MVLDLGKINSPEELQKANEKLKEIEQEKLQKQFDKLFKN